MSENKNNNYPQKENTTNTVNSSTLPDDYLSPNSTLSEFSSTLLNHYLTTYGAWKVTDGTADKNGVLLSAIDDASPYSINR